MNRRNAAKLLAPASPAETAVVVPWNGTSSSAGIPIAEPYGNAWACKSTSPGVTRRPEASRGVQDLERAFGGDVRLYRFDDAVAGADVAHAAKALARVHDITAFDQQIEIVVGGHC